MIKSMTGYGKASINLDNTTFNLEVKSLNSKQIDINLKMPSIYRDQEIYLRNLISKKLQRGKIDFSIWRESSQSTNYTFNSELINRYYKQIKKITNELNTEENNLLTTIMKFPDVIQKEEYQVSQIGWNSIQIGINNAITDLLKFRQDEGKKLESDIKLRISRLQELLTKIIPFSKKRIKKVKRNLHQKFELIDNLKIDENRLEQELIYYLEKQDISEEHVRLETHLSYFIETMKSASPNGKKLGFIAQEIGREINTIGSKSSEVNMQKIVIQMKDELEKIKEQLLNIL